MSDKRFLVVFTSSTQQLPTLCRISVGNSERWATHDTIQWGMQNRIRQLLHREVADQEHRALSGVQNTLRPGEPAADGCCGATARIRHQCLAGCAASRVYLCWGAIGWRVTVHAAGCRNLSEQSFAACRGGLMVSKRRRIPGMLSCAVYANAAFETSCSVRQVNE